MRSTILRALALLAAAASVSATRAGLNDPIAFSQPGNVTLTLDASGGGFDHILEQASTTGAIGTPILALTDVFAPSADVLGYTPALLGDTADLGSVGAGEELIFRLTNVESERLGTPGTIADQTFSGSASGNNPSPTSYYTFVDFVDANTITVYWEDAFPISPTDPDPEQAFFDGGLDLAFTLTLTPVPEPATWTLLAVAAGLLAVARVRRRVA